jgi:queuine tRNA-ribosyltransferase
VTQNELLGLRLLSLHNLRFLLELTAGARRAIEERRFDDYRRGAVERMQRTPEEAACSR